MGFEGTQSDTQHPLGIAPGKSRFTDFGPLDEWGHVIERTEWKVDYTQFGHPWSLTVRLVNGTLLRKSRTITDPLLLSQAMRLTNAHTGRLITPEFLRWLRA